jgi:membrane associated rhomboid family serine protease
MFPLRDTVPSHHRPWAVWGLILVNGIVFAAELLLSHPQLERAFILLGIVPRRYTDPGWGEMVGFPSSYWPFVTHMFLHAGWLHFVGNMWTLWIFGDNVEDRMGAIRFLAFYLACGIVAGIAQTLASSSSAIPSIGASGAIAGVMGAYFLLYPHARVITLVPLLFYPLFVEIPAVLYLGVWFLMQLFSGTLSLGRPGEAGGIAFLAHVGGFVAGFALHGIFLSRRRAPRRPPARPEDVAWP